MKTYQVGYLIGSLSSTSINRVLSKALIKVAPDDMEFIEIPIGNLPLYSPDYDPDYPPEARALKEQLASVDAVLFVTPEYNRGLPGAPQERDRLGEPALGRELVRAQADRHDRRLDRQDRHRRRPAEPEERPELLQRAADERAGGLHPVRARPVHRGGEVTDPTTAQFLTDYMKAFRGFICRVLAVVKDSGEVESA